MIGTSEPWTSWSAIAVATVVESNTLPHSAKGRLGGKRRLPPACGVAPIPNKKSC